jgi:hypothetical protein
MSFVALSKGYVGGLYVDITASPYKALFNSSTSSRRLWSVVQLLRRIDKVVKLNAGGSPTQRGIVVHGNRFIAHCMLRQIGKTADLAASDSIKDDVVENAVTRVLSGVEKVIDKDYVDAYLAPLFKNVKKCSDIRTKLEKS